MTRPKKTPGKRGRKPIDPDGGAVAGATRSARYRSKAAACEAGIAASWLRLAAAAAISAPHLSTLVGKEIETLGGGGCLGVLRSRLRPEDREHLDAIGETLRKSLKEPQISCRDEIEESQEPS